MISGAKAHYKGMGTINGRGSYRFVLTVTDGQRSGGRTDRFRIKIRNTITNSVVYDSERTYVPGTGWVSDAEDADARTAIGGGNIAIQTR